MYICIEHTQKLALQGAASRIKQTLYREIDSG